MYIPVIKFPCFATTCVISMKYATTCPDSNQYLEKKPKNGQYLLAELL